MCVVSSLVCVDQVLVGQQYFDPSDLYRRVRDKSVDKFVTDHEFLVGKEYGVRAVLTNVTSGSVTVSALVQLPQVSDCSVAD